MNSNDMTRREYRLPISALYFATATLASFASALVTGLGIAAALLLFVSIVPLWISLGRWGPWLPVIGSGALISYFLPLYVASRRIQEACFCQRFWRHIQPCLSRSANLDVLCLTHETDGNATPRFS